MHPGDQHRDCDVFDKMVAPVPSEVEQLQYATLRARLDQQLGPEYISTRSNGPSGNVAYLEGAKVIQLANEIFGFDGWSTSVVSCEKDYVDEHNGAWNIGLSVIMRVTLSKTGNWHEDMGYGSAMNVRTKDRAFGLARKEATTDALKRALRHFGNALGNCLTDKTYMNGIKEMHRQMRNRPAPKFDPGALYRRPEFREAPVVQAEAAALAPPPQTMQQVAPAPTTTVNVNARSVQPQAQAKTVSAVPNANTSAAAAAAQAAAAAADFAEDIGDMSDFEMDFDEDRNAGWDADANISLDANTSPDSSLRQQAGSEKTVADNGKQAAANQVIPPSAFMNSRQAPAAQATTMDAAAAAKQAAMEKQEANRQRALKLREERRQQHLASAAATTASNDSGGGNGQVSAEPPVHAEIQATEPAPSFQPAFMNARTLVNPATEAARFDPKLQSPSIPKSGAVDPSKSTPIKRPGLVQESPVAGAVGSPLRPNAGASPAPVGQGMMTRGQNQFRQPSKLSYGTRGGVLLSAKRTSEALAEHPGGAASLNEAGTHAPAAGDKRPRV